METTIVGLLVSRPKLGDSSLGGRRSLSGVLFVASVFESASVYLS